MSFLNSNNFLDRQAAAAKARKALAEKFLSRPKYDPNDPAVVEREAKRRAILEARAERDAERLKRKAEAEAAEAARRVAEEGARQEALRLEALAREAAETARREEEARQEALRQEALAREAVEAARSEEEARLEYERKLDRDARYAARKERKKKAKSAIERYR